MLRIQKVRDGEDAIGPSRTGPKPRDARATQIFHSFGRRCSAYWRPFVVKIEK
jgi:hypothetical protein